MHMDQNSFHASTIKYDLTSIGLQNEGQCLNCQ
jgi:hypothetical protein